MRKIAIVTFYDIDTDDNNYLVAQSISEWTEVSDEDFERIRVGVMYLPYKSGIKYKLVELQEQTNIINECLIAAKKVEDKRNEREKKEKIAAEKRKNKRKLSKLQQFEKLKEELGK